MACLEPVIFGLLGRSIRVQRLYDRAKLRLGSLVYVRLSAQEDGTEFSPNFRMEVFRIGFDGLQHRSGMSNSYHDSS